MKGLLFGLLLIGSFGYGQSKVVIKSTFPKAGVNSAIDSALNANTFVLRNSKATGDSNAVASGSNGFIFPKTTYSGAIQMLHSAGDTSRSVIIVGKADSAATITALAGKAATVHSHDSTTVTGLHGENYYNNKYAPIGLVAGTAGNISYDTTANFYYDTTSGKIVVRQGLYKRKFKPSDSTLIATVLATPGSFAATPASSSQINLTWADVSNESNYLLERSPNGSSSWTTINSPAANSTSYSNTGLTASTAYFYRLSAIGNGTSYSNSAYTTANATTSAGVANTNALFTGSGITNTAQVYSPANTSGGYGHLGADNTQSLAAGVTGRIYTQLKLDGQNYWIGLSTSSGNKNFYETLVSYQVLGQAYTIKTWDNANFGPTVGTGAADRYIGIWRNGATGQMKVQISTDAITWTDLTTLTSTSTAKLYGTIDLDYDPGYSSKAYYPKWEGATP